jgi:signal peptidase II
MSEQRDEGPRGATKLRLVILVAAWVLSADLITKAWVQSRFRLGESVGVLGDWLRLTYVLNPGAAFGIHVGPWSRPVFVSLAVVAVLALAHVVRLTPPAERLRLWALALIMGGALGNLTDRLRAHASVVDFLDVGVGPVRWPVFNLADVGVTVGAVLLVMLLWGDEGMEAAEASPTAPPGAPGSRKAP